VKGSLARLMSVSTSVAAQVPRTWTRNRASSGQTEGIGNASSPVLQSFARKSSVCKVEMQQHFQYEWGGFRSHFAVLQKVGRLDAKTAALQSLTNPVQNKFPSQNSKDRFQICDRDQSLCSLSTGEPYLSSLHFN
jgi:hypothetical protein